MADNDHSVFDDSSEQVEVRRQKLAKLRDAGNIVYPNDFSPTHSVQAAIAAAAGVSDEDLHENKRNVCIAGRIMALRRDRKSVV